MEIPQEHNRRALEHLKRGQNLKKEGQFDIALTEFRRAIIEDATLAQAHLEAALLYKKKGNDDPSFYKHAFDAIQKAARLNLESQEIHDQYISIGHKVGKLEDLHQEYNQWVELFPNNDVLKRCQKNIIALSMALIPDAVGVGDGMNTKLKKTIFIISMGVVLIGGILLFSPIIFQKTMNKSLSKEQSRNVVRIGFLLELAAVAGFVSRGFIR